MTFPDSVQTQSKWCCTVFKYLFKRPAWLIMESRTSHTDLHRRGAYSEQLFLVMILSFPSHGLGVYGTKRWKQAALAQYSGCLEPWNSLFEQPWAPSRTCLGHFLAYPPDSRLRATVLDPKLAGKGANGWLFRGTWNQRIYSAHMCTKVSCKVVGKEVGGGHRARAQGLV